MRLSTAVVLMAAILVCGASPASAKASNVVKIFDDVVVESNMGVHDIVVIGGNVTVFGKVEGGVFVIAGDICMKPGSEVKGDIVSIAGDVIRESDTVINGNLTQLRISRLIPSLAAFFKRGWVVVLVMLSVFVLIGFLGLAILLMALAPKHMGAIIIMLEDSFMRMLAWGFLWCCLIAIMTGFLVISVVGILLIPLEILLVALAMIIGYIASAAFVGRNILKTLNRTIHPLVEAIVGITLLFFIGYLPIIGSVIKSLLLIAGFGAVMMTGFGSHSKG